jgi:uncharacterized membrane protein
MSWQILVALSVLLFSFNNLFHKVLMRDAQSDPYAQTIAFYGLGGIFALFVSLFRGGFHYQISFNQLPFFFLLAVFGTAAPVLGFKAFKLIEASEISILQSSQRLWIVLGAFLLLHESFSIYKLVGAVIILLGITIAQWKKQRFVFNYGVLFILLASLSYAIAEIISFFILRNFDAVSFNVYNCFLPVMALIIFTPKTIKKLAYYFKPKRGLNISIVSVTDTLATFLLFFAYQAGRNASQIAPIMATQTIISVLLATVILKEKNNWINKLIGAIIVVIGLILVL